MAAFKHKTGSLSLELLIEEEGFQHWDTPDPTVDIKKRSTGQAHVHTGTQLHICIWAVILRVSSNAAREPYLLHPGVCIQATYALESLTSNVKCKQMKTWHFQLNSLNFFSLKS